MLPSLDVPFSKDDANRLLPWIIAFMSFLTALLLAGALTLSSVVMKNHATYTDTILVQIPYQSKSLPEKAEAVRKLLTSAAGVESVTLVRDSKIKKMIAPWLGEGEALDALPLPALLEVHRAPGATIDMSALAASVHNIVPDAQVDDNQAWVGKFTDFTRMIQWVGFGLSVFIVFTMSGMIVLAARTALRLHFRTVVLLHSLGAEDRYIIRQFQWNAFLLALKGGAIGMVLAWLMYFLIGVSASQIDTPLLPSFDLTGSHVMMFLFLPLLTGVIALFSARAAVQALLERLP